MMLARSLLFSLVFYGWTAAMAIVFVPSLAMPRGVIVWGQRQWARSINVALRLILGVRVEIRGLRFRPTGAALLASKHQSAWDTLIWHVLLDDPAIVMKAELLWIPIYGWYCKKAGEIPVDRGAGAAALRPMLRAARARRDAGRQIMIFPEGTRTAPGTRRPYQIGVAALYRDLGLPVVPVALNSGLFWPRRGLHRRSGTIILEFLPPIAPGASRLQFLADLEDRIETASTRLIAEAE